MKFSFNLNGDVSCLDILVCTFVRLCLWNAAEWSFGSDVEFFSRNILLLKL